MVVSGFGLTRSTPVTFAGSTGTEFRLASDRLSARPSRRLSLLPVPDLLPGVDILLLRTVPIGPFKRALPATTWDLGDAFGPVGVEEIESKEANLRFEAIEVRARVVMVGEKPVSALSCTFKAISMDWAWFGSETTSEEV